MKIGICDDNGLESQNIAKSCKEYLYAKDFKEQIDIFVYQTGEELMNEKSSLNLIFLDIEMEGRNGLIVSGMLRNSQPKAFIIFVSSHTECMQEAFGTNVMGFLNKPVDKFTFYKIMNKIMEEYISNICIEIVDLGTGIPFVIQTDDILYIEGERVYTQIYTKNGCHNVRRSLNEWEIELKLNGFFRVHKSYMVNMGHVVSVGKCIELYGGKYIPIGRSKKQQFENEFSKYMWKVARYI